MTLLQFQTKLMFTKDKAEQEALCNAYPEYARQCASFFKRAEPLPPMPVPQTIHIEGESQVGTIIEHEGHSYRVTHCRYIDAKEARDIEDINDVSFNVGWHAWASLV